MKQHVLKIVAAALLAGAALLLLIFIAFSMTRGSVQDRDFLAYWAAGQQLAHRANPYDVAQVLQLEHSVGLVGSRPNMMLNWPLALFITIPLGYVSARTGMILWLLVIAACLVTAIHLLRRSLRLGEDRIHLAGYAFAPVVACLMAGQMGTMMLLGVSGFLCFHRSRPFTAGAALILCALKPHLFVPFGLVLLAWAIRERAFRVLTGAGLSTCLALVIAWVFDPHAWSHYAQMMSATAEVQRDFVPCFSQFFRLAVSPETVWLQFLPAAAGCLWAVAHYVRNRAQWDWWKKGMLVLLVSVLVAPHAWFTDEAVVLPAVFACLKEAESRGRSLAPFGMAAVAALMETLAGIDLTSAAYAWTAPAWLLAYLYATRRSASKSVVLA